MSCGLIASNKAEEFINEKFADAQRAVQLFSDAYKRNAHGKNERALTRAVEDLGRWEGLYQSTQQQDERYQIESIIVFYQNWAQEFHEKADRLTGESRDLRGDNLRDAKRKISFVQKQEMLMNKEAQEWEKRLDKFNQDQEEAEEQEAAAAAQASQDAWDAGLWSYAKHITGLGAGKDEDGNDQ